ncbi:MAG: hypothetical protein K6D94_02775 [Clostridiales bacterium]|nr:hypothetical protein [Clostridiales bacterium]
MEPETLTDLLGVSEERSLYEAGRLDDLKKALRKRRCILLDELHEKQRKVDRLDIVIRITEKEIKERNEK